MRWTGTKKRKRNRFDTGLEGDRFKGRETSKRQVTLIQKEHLHAIASCLHREAIEPDVFRRPGPLQKMISAYIAFPPSMLKDFSRQ